MALAAAVFALGATLRAAPLTPRMDPVAARAMAEAVARQIKGTKVVAVTANGSLKPVFDEDAFLVVEPTRPEAVKVGDIVMYEQPATRAPVVQRVIKLRDLPAAGPGAMMRIVVIIYARNTAGAAMAAAAPKKPAGVVAASSSNLR